MSNIRLRNISKGTDIEIEDGFLEIYSTNEKEFIQMDSKHLMSVLKAGIKEMRDPKYSAEWQSQENPKQE